MRKRMACRLMLDDELGADERGMSSAGAPGLDVGGGFRTLCKHRKHGYKYHECKGQGGGWGPSEGSQLQSNCSVHRTSRSLNRGAAGSRGRPKAFESSK